eukprot:CAMPEP_0114989304 /NCGR_PEP_ID=MMETSP0216-20121206/10120_1 /TAXON_ID=223996 /ORGANISM="Protocruzia adherens, Strain Boccale" /LENGTH=584 /DNA_ID=CAMNT_0002352261 /DNA_START=234 /DNA_END=1988 /DNA_ORIENTATION=+
MMLSWGVVAFVGQLVTFFYNHKRNSGVIHSLAGIFTSIATCSTVLFFVREGELHYPTSGLEGLHSVGGFIILSFAIYQLVVGIAFKGILMYYKGGDSKEEKLSVFSFWAKRIHIYIGYAILAYSAVQVGSGVAIHWPWLLPFVIVWYCLILTLEVILYHRKSQEGKEGYTAISRNEDPVNALLSFKSFEEVQREWQKQKPIWMIYEGTIYDVSTYAKHHPGGLYIFKASTFHDDVGRYLDGGYGYSVRIPAHLHNKKILEELMPKYQVAIINIQQTVMTFLDPKVKMSFHPVWNECAILAKHDLTSDTSVFYFKADSFGCFPDRLAVTDLGRHFRLATMIEGKEVARYYTTIFAFSVSRSKKRTDYCKKLGVESNSKGVEDLDMSLNTSLPLCIKKYPFAGAKMTPFLHQFKNVEGEGNPEFSCNFQIIGPSGLGLGLSPQSKGLHIALVAGTGVLPFLDLYDFILERAMEHDVERLSGDGNFLQEFQIVTHATFRTQKEALGLEIMKACEKACQQNKLRTAEHFEFYFSKEDNKRLRPDVVESNKSEFQRAEKIYVCGPPSFNDGFKFALRAIGIPREKVFFI